MKTLSQLIIENLNNKQKTLVNFINNLNDTNDNDKEIIDTLYNTYKKIYKDSDNVDYFNSIKNLIEEKMKKRNDQRHLSQFLQSIYSSCEKYKCYEQIGIIAKEQLKENTNSFFKINLNSNSNNYPVELSAIENYFNNFLKETINKKEDYKNIEYTEIPSGFWKSILNKEAAGQPVMGKGEFLLIFICNYPDGKGGDVTVNGKSVEVKNLGSNEAKLGNSKKGNVLPIFDFINEIKPEYIDEIKPQTLNKNITDRNKKVFEDIQEILKSTDKSIDDLADILKDKLYDNFYFDKNVKPNIDIKPVRQAIVELIDIKNLNINEFSKKFVKIFTILYIILYCNSENAEFICLIDRNTNFNFISINNDTFKNLMNEDSFPIFMIRYSGGVNLVLIKYTE